MDVNYFQYKIWADKRTLRVIEQSHDAVCSKTRTFLRQQLNHMIIVEELFKSRLLGLPAPHSKTNTDIVPEFQNLKQRLLASGSWYIDFLQYCDDLDRSIQFDFTDGKKGRMTKREILFHIVTHGSYHRGNIAHALDLAGVPHPVDGYGVFLHEIEPERRHPS